MVSVVAMAARALETFHLVVAEVLAVRLGMVDMFQIVVGEGMPFFVVVRICRLGSRWL